MDIDKKITGKLKESILESAPEEYIPGAWEGFLAGKAVIARRRRNRILAYSSFAAAAVLLIGLLLPSGQISIERIDLILDPVKNQITSVEKNHLHVQLLSNRAKPLNLNRKVMAYRESPQAEFEAKPIELVQEGETEHVAQNKQVPESEKPLIDTKEKQIQEEPENEKKMAFVKQTGQQTLGRIREEDRKGVRFGVNISPGFNSSSASASRSFNYAGGVTMDISLAKNISISTGLQVEHQNVDNQKKEGAGIAAMPSSHIEATLTSLDIPLNITWRFYTGKSGSYYLSGGVSTLAYLDEKYKETSYRQEVMADVRNISDDETLTTYKVKNIEDVSTTTHSPSNALDVAGRLNLIFGYEQRISPKLNLHIEPFVKIPLSGLASENIKFTTGGVTFKISF